MYVAVKGGEQAIAAAHRWLAEERRGDPAVPELVRRADRAAARRSRCDRVMNEGSLYDRAARGAGDQAGAGRPDRGGLPAARLSHHPAALRLQRAARHRAHGDPAADLGDLQGPAGRPGAGPDLRLHPPAARFRAGGRRRRSEPAPERPRRRGTSRCRASSDILDARGADRGASPPTAGRAGRRSDARAARCSRPDATCACRTSRAATRASCWPSAIRPSAATAAAIRSSARSGSAR